MAIATTVLNQIRISRIFLGFLALQACSSDRDAPADSEEKAPFPVSSSDDLSATLDGVVAGEIAPGVVLTVEHPSYRTWSGASGVANIATAEALTPAARFRAGSLMKVPVAVAALQLVERNELDLDAKLTELVPAGVASKIPDSDAITLRMLLSHTSGIPEFSTPEFDAELASNPTRVWTFDELLDRALAVPPMFAPGSGWSYSNTNYQLLGQILEQTSGKPWRRVVRDAVLARANLERSELPEEGNARCDGCARGYEAIDDALVDFTEVDPSMAGPAGGGAFVTTTEDIATFASALASGLLFDDPGTLELMLDFVDAEIPEEAQSGYGLGLQRFQVGEIELIGHLGGTAGYQGFMFVQPGTGLVASGYMNRQGDFGGFIVPALEAIGRVE